MAKEKTEVLSVQMENGTVQEFAGKRKVNKRYILDETKIQTDGEVVQFGPGAVKLEMGFRNGALRTFVLPLSLIAQFAGHGAEQKYGDELAAPADKPLSEDDMVLAVEDLDSRIQRGEWRVAREGGGGVSGASIVVLALMEASGKDRAAVQAFLQGKLDSAKAKGEELSRKELYDSFRNPKSKVGQIIARMDAEKLAKATKVDADSATAELSAA